MNMRCLSLLTIFLLIPGFSNIINAHGLRYKIIEGGIGIEAMYADDTPLSFSNVIVFAPDDRKEHYITGYTDRKGRFLFFPNTKGEWIIKVSDGMGHALEAEIYLQDDLKISRSSSGNLSNLQITTMAICVIWGFIGTGLYFIRRKKN